MRGTLAVMAQQEASAQARRLAELEAQVASLKRQSTVTEFCEEDQTEALQRQIDAQNSTVIISSGVSRDVQVITPGTVIDLRK